LGRRRKPSHWSVNWTVVIVAAVLTLGIGITVAVLNNDGKSGRIVVPQPSTTAVPLQTTTSLKIEPAAGTVRTSSKATPRATTLPGTSTRQG
jgi:hypothetical protein